MSASGTWMAPAGFSCVVDNAAVIVFNSQRLCHPSVNWFDPNHPAFHGEPVQNGGRDSAWFTQVNNVNAVLRHYRRGGWAAKLSRNYYLWFGMASTRPARELSLLQSLVVQGLPVARPLAAAVWRKGIFYRAALMTERIEGAVPLAAVRDIATWTQAGELIARMHHLGVYHADLNVFNVLLDHQGQLWLIDFDRGWQGVISAKQRRANTDRLLRSVQKVLPHADRQYFEAFMAGYDRAYDSGKNKRVFK